MTEVGVSDVEIRWALRAAVPAEQRAAARRQRFSATTVATLSSAAVIICAHDLLTLLRGVAGP